VAVLGTGIMGAPMAGNLARAGLDVFAWNRTRAKAEPLAAEGVAIAESPAEAVATVEAVLTMLTDVDTVREVMVDGGALNEVPADAVWVQASTVGIAGTEELMSLAQAREIAFLDAPVLGTKAPAEAGELVVLASGEEPDRARAGPLFDAIGSRTVWLGSAGAGTRAKLVVNNWVLGLTASLAETVALAEALDIDPARFLEVIEGGPTCAPYARIKGEMMIGRAFAPSFPLALAAKDARLVLEAAERDGLELAVADAVARRFAEAIELGAGDEDMAAVYRAITASGQAARS
jgi:3-hydroxyisobutyrate dehydrogenase